LCLDKAYDAEEAKKLLEELDYEGHIKRRGQSDEPRVGEPVYRAPVEGRAFDLVAKQHAQAASSLGEEGGELPGAVVASRRAHHLPPDSFGMGF
jgi:hypothetical protein